MEIPLPDISAGISLKGKVCHRSRVLTRIVTIKSKNGNLFVGEFLGNRKEGHGKLTYSDGRCFEGEYSFNRRHGPGILTFANGDYLAGNWVDGKMVIILSDFGRMGSLCII